MTITRCVPRQSMRRIALCLALAAIGTASAAEPGGDVVARLGTSDITVAQLQDFMRSLAPALRKQAASDANLMNSLVRDEIVRMAVLREATAQNWQQRPDVEAQIARARDQIIVSTFLDSVSAPPADFPSEAAIESAYDMNRDKFMVPRQYDLQQIFIALPAAKDKNAIAAAQQKAEELARKAKEKNADFAALARQNSDQRSTAEHGGEMGWTAEDRIVPDIRNQIASMSNGDVSGPIRLADGWHIVRLVNMRPAAVRPLAEVKDTIIAALRNAKAQQNARVYIARLQQKTPISINEIGLQKIFATAP